MPSTISNENSSLLDNINDNINVNDNDIEQGTSTSTTQRPLEQQETETNEDNNAGGDDNDDDDDDDDNNPNDNDNDNNRNNVDAEITRLTNGLRILFFTLTLPVIPLAAILGLLIIQLLFTSITSPSCGPDHHLKLYAFLTLLMSLYGTNHKKIRNWLFNYDRIRDGIHRPGIVRVYDQCFHLTFIMYVYYGMVIVQSCQDDLVDAVIVSEVDVNVNANAKADAATSDGVGLTNTTLSESVCSVSCPDLFLSMQRFVFMLKIFFMVILLPLICLPFIYVWIISRINTEEAFNTDGTFNTEGGWGRFSNNNNNTVLVKEIIEDLKDVVLIPIRMKKGEDESVVGGVEDTTFHQVRIVEKGRQHIHLESYVEEQDALLESEGNDNKLDIKDWDVVKDCCICLSQFPIYEKPTDGGDGATTSNDNSRNIEESRSLSMQPQESIRDRVIVQTKCGHLFHKSCIGSWIGGEWNDELNELSNSTIRATRRLCPLCRKDLAPDSGDS